ncbi:LacI family DNA-binding transcriptional regulator [Pasteurellaceae bacterium LIM206]|nr:LacI family DNA-binding transcriptional regulator [Pasteurellaceae bacterium LIM206]
MASLKDVAKLAGVSLMTVSRALNNPEKLSAGTREKVRSAIERLNYVPNVAAQNIRGVANQKIGVLSLNTATTPFSVEIILAIEQTVRQHNWHSFVINAFENDEEEMERAVSQLISHRPSAVIIARNGLKNIHIPEKLKQFPVVLANCVSDSSHVASYIPDDYHGQYAIAERIIQQGYKRPLFLHIPANYIATQARKTAFEDRWLAEPKAAPIVQYFMPADGENYFDGAKPLLDLLDKNPEHFPFDVIVCGNDRIAFVVYQILLARRFNIPQDIAVTGYDNMVGISHLFLPSLTTVQLPHYEMGKQAALHFIEQRQDHEVHRLTCPLILGNSC